MPKSLELAEASQRQPFLRLTMFGRENCLVVDGLLDVGHEQVDVLRRRQSRLLALLVHPQVLPGNVQQAR